MTHELDRRTFLEASLAVSAAATAAATLGAAPALSTFDLEEATLDQLQAGLATGRWSTRELASTASPCSSRTTSTPPTA